MSADLIVFLVLALVAIATALGMLLSQNSVYAALFLVLNFMTVAAYYLLLGAPFIAMIQITVYAGAIMVLFLFVIMLLGVQGLPRSTSLPWQKPLAYLLAVILLVESLYLVVSRARSQLVITPPEASANTLENLREMALTLFNQYLLPFEVTSVLLLIAMLGAIVLTKHGKGGQS